MLVGIYNVPDPSDRFRKIFVCFCSLARRILSYPIPRGSIFAGIVYFDAPGEFFLGVVDSAFYAR